MIIYGNVKKIKKLNKGEKIMAKYVCSVCGYEYDEEVEGVPFAELGDDWTCPICCVEKENFEIVE